MINKESKANIDKTDKILTNLMGNSVREAWLGGIPLRKAISYAGLGEKANSGKSKTINNKNK